ncbi:hypothetical protein B0H11DRAFT_2287806, partial [Mycena galericulata]
PSPLHPAQHTFRLLQIQRNPRRPAHRDTTYASLYPKRKARAWTGLPGVNGALLCSRRPSAFCTPRATFSWNSRSAPLSTSAAPLPFATRVFLRPRVCRARARVNTPRVPLRPAPSAAPFRYTYPHTPPFLPCFRSPSPPAAPSRTSASLPCRRPSISRLASSLVHVRVH